jgi:hypothetical protein
LIVENTVIAGYDNGKLVALNLHNGKYIWEISLAMPKGRSEVERLVDLDADPIEVNGVIFISGYKGGVSAISASDGDVMWHNENVSSYTGLSHDFRYMYLSDTHSHVWQQYVTGFWVLVQLRIALQVGGVELLEEALFLVLLQHFLREIFHGLPHRVHVDGRRPHVRCAGTRYRRLVCA